MKHRRLCIIIEVICRGRLIKNEIDLNRLNETKLNVRHRLCG
uniref:Uncharacterized protein n=1 Tax=Anguilla anguilla TaxID=7936 RepID=A0A0E9S548_ANGAN